jgi:hypothetical protein
MQQKIVALDKNSRIGQVEKTNFSFSGMIAIEMKQNEMDAYPCWISTCSYSNALTLSFNVF